MVRSLVIVSSAFVVGAYSECREQRRLSVTPLPSFTPA